MNPLNALLSRHWREIIESHLVWLLVLGRFPISLFRRPGAATSPWTLVKVLVATQWGVTLLRLFCDVWMSFVNTSVPEPYLVRCHPFIFCWLVVTNRILG